MGRLQYQTIDNGPFGSSVVVPINTTITGEYISVTADNTTDTFTAVGHGLVNTNRVFFYAGTLPAGITGGTVYYVVNAAANTFQISTTSGGGVVNFTTDGVSIAAYKATPIFTLTMPLQSMASVEWHITCKTRTTTAQKGYFIMDTCWIRTAGNIETQQSIYSQTTQRTGSSSFHMSAGIDIETQTGIIFACSPASTIMDWVGYITYNMITG